MFDSKLLIAYACPPFLRDGPNLSAPIPMRGLVQDHELLAHIVGHLLRHNPRRDIDRAPAASGTIILIGRSGYAVCAMA